MTVALLKKLGHEVRSAADGPEALLAVREYNPEVVLLDIGLPGMDGYEVARCVRMEMGEAAPVLVAMTGYSQHEVNRHARRAEFDHHLVKPADISVLRDLLTHAKIVFFEWAIVRCGSVPSGGFQSEDSRYKDLTASQGNSCEACEQYSLRKTINKIDSAARSYRRTAMLGGEKTMSHILVIDDDRSVRHLIAKAFEESDVEVVPAATAEEGMQLLGSKQFDVVLLDILLPESSGLDLFERIRKVDSKLPVIFITSLSSSDTAIKAMTLGAFDYLLKPLDLARIRDLVRQAIEIRRLMSIPVEMPGAKNGGATDGMANRSDTLVGNSPQMQEVYKAIGRRGSARCNGARSRRKRHGQGIGGPRVVPTQPAR